MTAEEFSDQFDVLYNNITSNQAPGCTEYEKSVFLTKAQNEIVKNYFTANSKGNNIGQGFDDSAKRQADFSCLMMTKECTISTAPSGYIPIDYRSSLYTFPLDVFIVINETVQLSVPKDRVLQVVPLRYDDYLRLMSKPFKRPLKYQAWRLLNRGASDGTTSDRYAELIIGPNHTLSTYHIRYIRFPKPIIVGDLDGLTIDGYEFGEGSGPTPPTPPTPTPTVRQVASCDYDVSDDGVSIPSSLVGTKVFKLSTYDRQATSSTYTIEYSDDDTQFFYVVATPDGEGGYNYTMDNAPYASLDAIKSQLLQSDDQNVILLWLNEKSAGANTLTVYETTATRSTATSTTSGTAKYTQGCELDPVIHQDILQRAVELAKVSWTATGQDNAQTVLQAGQRSE